mmetsp:Transcript_34359/g.84558  ORF Transcript_34359/g.84558 Transcript_34359/m.84558 type:complete len:233 (+) Transcript_34359:1022-1720(+)
MHDHLEDQAGGPLDLDFLVEDPVGCAERPRGVEAPGHDSNDEPVDALKALEGRQGRRPRPGAVGAVDRARVRIHGGHDVPGAHLRGRVDDGVARGFVPVTYGGVEDTVEVERMVRVCQVQDLAAQEAPHLPVARARREDEGPDVLAALLDAEGFEHGLGPGVLECVCPNVMPKLAGVQDPRPGSRRPAEAVPPFRCDLCEPVEPRVRRRAHAEEALLVEPLGAPCLLCDTRP